MEPRTRFAIGGAATVVASVAVVCAVALTNSVALADTRGVAIGGTPLVVPRAVATPEPTATVDAPVASSATPTPTPEVSVAPAEPDASVEVVPAPAPHEVDAPEADAPETVEEIDLDAAAAAGRWAELREWAAAKGWSSGRIDAWIANLEKNFARSQEPATDRLGGADHIERRSAVDESEESQSRETPDQRD
ncbi:hypothetical protein [Microbacterium hominis]|uniref:Uncharacterized protein n=1 Tax=Microbacterium hominis TaxID=162426 RepID=A0A7D4TMK0_9MICO|nr:hypothetical protein [Microbacterium hominis]QKJ19062.1 hypothetical protein HQM25_06520 [Microbacterium hominis]